jgi:hypothetical protein
MRPQHQLLVIVAAGALTLGFSPAWAATTIDNFIQPNKIETADSGSSVDDLQTDPEALGNERRVELSSPAGFAAVGIPSTGGVMQHINGPGVKSTLDLTYDNFTDEDLTAGGAQSFRALFSIVQGEGTLQMEVSDGQDSDTSEFKSITGNNDRGIERFFPFSEFDSSVDLTSVDSIGFQIDTTGTSGTGSSDFAIDTLETSTVVPEPASLALLAMGGGLMLMRSGRNRRCG